MKYFLMFIILILSTSCAGLKDVPVCKEIDIDEAYCVYILSGNDFIWNEENLYENTSYFNSRQSLILVPPSSYAAIKSYILKKRKNSESVFKFFDKL